MNVPDMGLNRKLDRFRLKPLSSSGAAHPAGMFQAGTFGNGDFARTPDNQDKAGGSAEQSQHGI
ncbi:MAG: hypothetical protein ACREN5_08570 [Gemmatimonadales bacterium]